MQCRASNPLARRIKGWSPKTCLGRPARKTRRTEVMKMKGEGGGTCPTFLFGRFSHAFFSKQFVLTVP